MRHLLIACLAVGLVGCDERTSSQQDAATDATANNDSATDGGTTAQDAPTPDTLAADGPPIDGPAADGPSATCAQTMTCITTNCDAGNMNTCVPACIDQLSPAAATYFNALEQCSQPACYSADGGVPPCATPSSTACSTCIATNCSSQVAACLSN